MKRQELWFAVVCGLMSCIVLAVVTYPVVAADGYCCQNIQDFPPCSGCIPLSGGQESADIGYNDVQKCVSTTPGQSCDEESLNCYADDTTIFDGGVCADEPIDYYYMAVVQQQCDEDDDRCGY